MKLRKTTVIAMLVLALFAACGDDNNPTGGDGTDTGGNTPTTAADTGGNTPTTAADTGGNTPTTVDDGY